MLKIKVGDKVKVLVGRDKNRDGIVEKILPKQGLVLVTGINVSKRHTKGFSGQKAGIYNVSHPLHLGKVAIICPKCKKATRVGFKFVGAEKKRICVKCGREIDLKDKPKKSK